LSGGKNGEETTSAKNAEWESGVGSRDYIAAGSDGSCYSRCGYPQLGAFAMSVEQSAGAAAKALEVLKDVPLWLLGGLAVAAGVLMWMPGLVPLPIRPWFIGGCVVFGTLAGARAIAMLFERMPVWKKTRDEHRRFHMTPEAQQSFWATSKQADGSITTQVVARLIVKNRTEEALGLSHVRLVKPRIRGEILHEDVSVRAVGRNLYGDAAHSGHLIPPKMILPASASVMIRGAPWRKPKNEVRVKIAIGDDEGHEQIVSFKMRVIAPPAATPARPALEMVSAISNPVEREVATVLQAELSRYGKCGRQTGGLGSVHFLVDGRETVGVGTDGWNPNSPKNQSIADNPEKRQLRSDNLEALMAFHEHLSPAERDQFASALTRRLWGKALSAGVVFYSSCAHEDRASEGCARKREIEIAAGRYQYLWTEQRPDASQRLAAVPVCGLHERHARRDREVSRRVERAFIPNSREACGDPHSPAVTAKR
jgi:hypothetical protein